MDRETSAKITARGRTTGRVRCLQCFERISFASGTKTAKCPNCGYEWRLSWNMGPDFPRIRGPVWETNRKLIEEADKKEQGEK